MEMLPGQVWKIHTPLMSRIDAQRWIKLRIGLEVEELAEVDGMVRLRCGNEAVHVSRAELESCANRVAS